MLHKLSIVDNKLPENLVAGNKHLLSYNGYRSKIWKQLNWVFLALVRLQSRCGPWLQASQGLTWEDQFQPHLHCYWQSSDVLLSSLMWVSPQSCVMPWQLASSSVSDPIQTERESAKYGCSYSITSTWKCYPIMSVVFYSLEANQ